jgi:hypothetical protein
MAVGMGEDREGPEVEPAGARARGYLILAGVTAGVVASTALGFSAWKGSTGLSASLLGSAIGVTIACISLLLKRRAWTAQGMKIAPALLLPVAASLGLFLAAALVVGFAWRAGVAPALLSALAVYFAASLVEAARGA